MKQRNEYVEILENACMYTEIPKAVLAAIAFSLAMRTAEDDFAEAVREVANEWHVLHACGIVPQKPPKHIRKRGNDDA